MRLFKQRPLVAILIVYLGSLLVFGLTAWAQAPSTTTTTGVMVTTTTSPTTATLAPATATVDKTTTTGAPKTAAPKPELKALPKKETKAMFAILDTSKGKIKIKLFKDLAPKSVENFVGLAEGTKEFRDSKTGKKTKGKYYDGLTFHRVREGFVIQGGCPLGNGKGGPGYVFDNEIAPTLKHDKAGVVAYANAGPNTNGSQFYITMKETPFLDGGYSIFGEVVEGMDVVSAINQVKTDSTELPLEPVVIKTVKIERQY